MRKHSPATGGRWGGCKVGDGWPRTVARRIEKNKKGVFRERGEKRNPAAEGKKKTTIIPEGGDDAIKKGGEVMQT